MKLRKLFIGFALLLTAAVSGIALIQAQNAQAAGIEGNVQSLNSSAMVIDGKTVLIDSNTRIEGPLGVGARAKVEAKDNRDGSFKALKVKVNDDNGKKDVQKQQDLRGVITSLTSSSLVVNGTTVSIGPETKIKGSLAIGVTVKVKAVTQNGMLLAREVQANKNGDRDGEEDDDEDERGPGHGTPVGPTTAPPSSVIATVVGPNRIDLTWVDNNNNESGFRIERATNNTFTADLVRNTVGAIVTSYSDTTVAAGVTYYYRVFAFRDSAPSNTASGIPSIVTAPMAPTTLAATAVSATRIDLTWVDNSNNESGFRIERSANISFSPFTVVATTAANAVGYSDTSVTGSATYYYRVVAYNAGGDSPVSNTAFATTPSTINAAALYSASCAICHGANRQGTGAGPALTPTSLSGKTDAQVYSVTANGKSSMPGYTSIMTVDQINALVQFMKYTAP